MDQKLLALLIVRGLASVALATGQTATAASLNLLADAYEAGKNVDAHMALVAERLRSGPLTDAHFADVTQRIQEDSAALQAL